VSSMRAHNRPRRQPGSFCMGQRMPMAASPARVEPMIEHHGHRSGQLLR
jgi:hypothetical protein